MTDMNNLMLIQAKKCVAEFLLAEAPHITIVILHRAAGVKLPPEAITEASGVVIDVGYRMKISAPDLIVDDEGIRATLSFGRTPYYCVLPWHAMVCIGAGGMTSQWPAGTPQSTKPSEPAKPRPSHLKAV